MCLCFVWLFWFDCERVFYLVVNCVWCFDVIYTGLLLGLDLIIDGHCSMGFRVCCLFVIYDFDCLLGLFAGLHVLLGGLWY